MKSTKRLFLGFCSSLFLAAGLARAAELLDPVSVDLRTQDDRLTKEITTCSEACTLPCAFD